MESKKVRVYIRIENNKKADWKSVCKKKNISLTSLIIDSVENRILDDERRKVLVFIEKQDNVFTKIETNINQVAKIANAQKFMSNGDLKNFSEQLKTVIELKKQQNEIFKKIYSLIANDY